MQEIESVNVEEGDTFGNKLLLDSHEISERVKQDYIFLKRRKMPKEAMHSSNFE